MLYPRSLSSEPRFFVVRIASGSIVRSGTVSENMIQMQCGEGETAQIDGAAEAWAEHMQALANPVLTLGQLKEKARARTLARRHQIQDQPYEVTVSPGKTLLIQIDADTLANLTGKVVLILAGMDASTPNWKQANGGCVPLSGAEIMAAAQSYSSRKQALFDREAALGAMIDAAQTAEALEALAPVVETFWPA